MPKRIPSAPLGHVVLAAENPRVHIEFMTDYTCPFCARLFARLTKEVIPWITENAAGQVKMTMFTMPQPWHPQSVALAEAVLAVETVDQAAYGKYVEAVYANREDKFIDAKAQFKTRNQLHEELVAIAVEAGIDGGKVAELLSVDKEGNMGSKITPLLKQYVKYGRKRAMHVTPTAIVNGLEDPSVSSGWTLEQWTEYLTGMLSTGDEKK